jgi:hypothetical protein
MDVLAILSLIDAEVTRASDPSVREVIARYRVAPRLEMRAWAYAPDTSFPCWIIFEHEASNTGICYSEYGFGPLCPWGLLWLVGGRQDMGDDSGWFPTLEGAVRDSCAWD